MGKLRSLLNPFDAIKCTIATAAVDNVELANPIRLDIWCVVQWMSLID